MPRTRRAASIEAIILGCLILLTVGLRVYRLDDEALWYDEIAVWQYVDAPTFTAHIKEARGFDPPLVPLHYAVQYGWASFFSESVYAARFVPVLLSAAVVVVLYLLGRMLFGVWAGAVASLLFFGFECAHHVRSGIASVRTVSSSGSHVLVQLQTYVP